MITTQEQIEVACSTCAAVAEFKAGKDGPCLKRGWTKHAGKIWCDKCEHTAGGCRRTGAADLEASDDTPLLMSAAVACAVVATTLSVFDCRDDIDVVIAILFGICVTVLLSQLGPSHNPYYRRAKLPLEFSSERSNRTKV